MGSRRKNIWVRLKTTRTLSNFNAQQRWVGNERLAAVGGVLFLNSIILFITLRPAVRKTRARKYKEFYCQRMRMELAVCVCLLESATPWL